MLVLTLRNRASGTDRELVVAEGRDVLILGRDPRTCDVVVDHVTISRRHLQLELLSDRVVVSDAHSASGAFINGLRLSGRQQVGPDDVVSVGAFDLRIARGLPSQLAFPDGDAPATSDPERVRRLAASGEGGAAALLWREGRRRGDLRLCFEAALQARPEALTWQVLVECLERWPEPRASLAEAVALAEAQLAAWPDALRAHVPSWWANVLGGLEDPRWRLVRTLRLESELPEERAWRRLAEQGALVHPSRLELVRCGHLTVELVQRLFADAEALPALRALRIEQATLAGQPALAALVESARIAGLDSLALDHCGLVDEAALLLARTEALRGLRRLELRGNRFTDRGAASFARSPVLGALEHFDLSGNPIGQPGIAALRTSVRIPQGALRYGPG